MVGQARKYDQDNRIVNGGRSGSKDETPTYSSIGTYQCSVAGSPISITMHTFKEAIP